MTPASFLGMMNPAGGAVPAEEGPTPTPPMGMPAIAPPTLNLPALGSLFKQEGSDNCANCTYHDATTTSCRIFDVEYVGPAEGSWCPWHEGEQEEPAGEDGDDEDADDSAGGADPLSGSGDSVPPQTIGDIE